MLSLLAQSGLPTSLSRRSRTRRIVVIGSEQTKPPLTSISARLRRRIEIVRVMSSLEINSDDKVSALLAPEVLRRENIWGVLIANGTHERLPLDTLFRCCISGIRVLEESELWEHEAGRVNIECVSYDWLVSRKGFRHYSIHKFGKRILDVTLAAVGLIISLPLILITSLLIKLDSRGPILYRQERVGLSGRNFVLWKFRSMRHGAEAGGPPRWAEIGDPRVTRVGRFIRYTRIDELPQLLNVLRGDMSIIGPRPERPYFVEQLAAAIPLYPLRHAVKPGITGWAQVSASYGASVEDTRVKLSYDLYYIKHRGLMLDFLILLHTMRVMIFGEGAR